VKNEGRVKSRTEEGSESETDDEGERVIEGGRMRLMMICGGGLGHSERVGSKVLDGSVV
jgi:hypothetical protein